MIPATDRLTGPRPTVAELNQQVLDTYRDRLRKLNYARTTTRNYAGTLSRLLRYYPDVPLEKLTPEHIERYLYSRTLSPRSVWTELETLRAFFTWCMKQQRLFKTHPCEGIERPRWKFRPRAAPTWEEFDALRRHCRTLEETAIVEVLYFAGVRIAELRSIRWRDVNLTTRRIRVLGKGAKERVVVFPQRVAELLRALGGPAPDPEAWLFASPVNKGYARAPEWIEAVLLRLEQAAGLPYHLTAHILRHGFFRLLKTRGVPVEVAARLGGHGRIQTTVEIYGRMNEDDLQGHYDRQLAELGE